MMTSVLIAGVARFRGTIAVRSSDFRTRRRLQHLCRCLKVRTDLTAGHSRPRVVAVSAIEATLIECL